MISTIEKILFLKRVQLFDEIPGEDLARVAHIARETNFEQGERFIIQGDIGDALYVIVQGEIDILVQGVGRVARLGERAFVGDMAILASTPRTADVVAVTPVIALRIDREDFWELMGDKPEIALGIIKVLCQRLDDANRKITSPVASKGPAAPAVSVAPAVSPTAANGTPRASGQPAVDNNTVVDAKPTPAAAPPSAIPPVRAPAAG